MKIAVWHNLPSGGGRRALYYHVRGLVARGHIVEAWCPSGLDSSYLPLSELVTEHVLPLDYQPRRLSNLLNKSSLISDELRHEEMQKARALDEHCRRCAEQINRGGFDVLFANSSVIQAVAPIGRYVRTPKVLYLQEPNRFLYEARAGRLPWVAPEAPDRMWARPRFLAWLLVNALGVQQLRVMARAELLNAKAFDLILVNSFFSRESVLRAYGIDAKVCYLGVDTELFVNRNYERENFVLGLGEIGWHKNIEFVIRSIGLLPAPRPRLVWIGNQKSDSYYEAMKRLAESLEVRFEIRNGIGDEELVQTLNRGAVLGYAPRLEPFGFAPLEANACGMPVVAVAEGGCRETVADGVTGLLVESEPQAMAAAFQRILSDRAYAFQLGRNGAEIVAQKWSVEAAVERLELHLERALADGN